MAEDALQSTVPERSSASSIGVVTEPDPNNPGQSVQTGFFVAVNNQGLPIDTMGKPMAAIVDAAKQLNIKLFAVKPDGTVWEGRYDGGKNTVIGLNKVIRTPYINFSLEEPETRQRGHIEKALAMARNTPEAVSAPRTGRTVTPQGSRPITIQDIRQRATPRTTGVPAPSIGANDNIPAGTDRVSPEADDGSDEDEEPISVERKMNIPGKKSSIPAIQDQDQQDLGEQEVKPPASPPETTSPSTEEPGVDDRQGLRVPTMPPVPSPSVRQTAVPEGQSSRQKSGRAKPSPTPSAGRQPTRSSDSETAPPIPPSDQSAEPADVGSKAVSAPSPSTPPPTGKTAASPKGAAPAATGHTGVGAPAASGGNASQISPLPELPVEEDAVTVDETAAPPAAAPTPTAAVPFAAPPNPAPKKSPTAVALEVEQVGQGKPGQKKQREVGRRAPTAGVSASPKPTLHPDFSPSVRGADGIGPAAVPRPARPIPPSSERGGIVHAPTFPVPSADGEIAVPQAGGEGAPETSGGPAPAALPVAAGEQPEEAGQASSPQEASEGGATAAAGTKPSQPSAAPAPVPAAAQPSRQREGSHARPKGVASVQPETPAGEAAGESVAGEPNAAGVTLPTAIGTEPSMIGAEDASAAAESGQTIPGEPKQQDQQEQEWQKQMRNGRERQPERGDVKADQKTDDWLQQQNEWNKQARDANMAFAEKSKGGKVSENDSFLASAAEHGANEAKHEIKRRGKAIDDAEAQMIAEQKANAKVLELQRERWNEWQRRMEVFIATNFLLCFITGIFGLGFIIYRFIAGNAFGKLLSTTKKAPGTNIVVRIQIVPGYSWSDGPEHFMFFIAIAALTAIPYLLIYFAYLIISKPSFALQFGIKFLTGQ